MSLLFWLVLCLRFVVVLRLFSFIGAGGVGGLPCLSPRTARLECFRVVVLFIINSVLLRVQKRKNRLSSEFFALGSHSETKNGGREMGGDGALFCRCWVAWQSVGSTGAHSVIIHNAQPLHCRLYLPAWMKFDS
ncbi:hypothetical protein B0T22DRAFT_266684 [Podospora appendiculata]|uniref:Uncharacterized protein n=1 Tax=Podospora appendiculata TaxID=314037 RepID=A0AAE0X3G7_9PEZI|nr:hypothetical protein B0T22DRAFT_266684 [Podospora appendiculata]